MWRWALLTCLAALVAAACVEVRLVPGGTPSNGGGGAGTTSSSTAGGSGGTGGTTPSCGCDELDALLIIDNTDSLLEDNIVPLLSVLVNLSDYVVELASRTCSFHFGVTSAVAKTNQPDAACNVLGALSYSDADGTECVPGERFMTDPDTIVENATCFVQTGSANDGNERLMQAMVTAVSDPTLIGPGGCNEGFLRPEAPLLLLFISDRDDDNSDIDGNLQPDDPQAWYQAAVDAKGGDASKVVAMGLLPPGANGEPCEGGLAPRFESFFNAFPTGQQQTADICNVGATEVQTKMENLADLVCPLPVTE